MKVFKQHMLSSDSKTIQWVLALCFTVWSGAVFAYPEARNDYVNDYAHMISVESELKIKKTLSELERDTGIRMEVVTIRSFGVYRTDQQSIGGFSTELFQRWDVGNRPDSDGVMLLIDNRYKRIRIELGDAYGRHYNASMRRVVETMIPYFAAGNTDQAVSYGVDAIIHNITSPFTWMQYYKWYILLGAILLVFMFFVVTRLREDWRAKTLSRMARGLWVLLAVLSLGLIRRREALPEYGGGAAGSW